MTSASLSCARIRPLTGWRVGVTAHRRADEQAELLRRRGATVVFGPVVRTLPFGDDRPLREATDALLARPPDLVIATTGIGIRSWFGAAESWGLDGALTDALAPARRVARGPKARAALAAVGLPSDVDEPSERLDRLVWALLDEGVSGRRIALQLFGEALPDVVDELRTAGADVVAVPIYRWTAAEDLDPARRLVRDLLAGHVDAVTFTSAAAVRSFDALAGDLGVADQLHDALSSHAVAACIGPVTAEAAERRGFGRRCTPERGRLGLLVRALSSHLHDRHRHLRVDGREVVVHGGSVWSADGHVELSGLERLLFGALAERPGVVVSRRALRQQIWGQQTGDSAIDSAVSRLRRALQPVGVPLDTVHRRGWAVGATADACPSAPDPATVLVG